MWKALQLFSTHVSRGRHHSLVVTKVTFVFAWLLERGSSLTILKWQKMCFMGWNESLTKTGSERKLYFLPRQLDALLKDYSVSLSVYFFFIQNRPFLSVPNPVHKFPQYSGGFISFFYYLLAELYIIPKIWPCNIAPYCGDHWKWEQTLSVFVSCFFFSTKTCTHKITHQLCFSPKVRQNGWQD